MNTTNDQAIFLANDQVLPHTAAVLALAPNNAHITETALLVRTGDFLQVTPGVTRKIMTITPFYTSSGNGRASLNDLGQVTFGGSPADFEKLIGEETEKWAKVVKFSGAKPD